MPKNISKRKTPSSDEEEALSLDDDIPSSGDDDYQDDANEEREVNKEHLLNYESDDSDSDVQGLDSDDNDDFGRGLKKQKEDLVMNEAWGSKKRNFYGRDKKKDVRIGL